MMYSGVLRCAGLYGDVWQCMGIRVYGVLVKSN